MFKRSLIETSGNDPFIVMASAPIDIAARGGAFGAYVNCGQVCTSSERFYVHEKVYASLPNAWETMRVECESVMDLKRWTWARWLQNVNLIGTYLCREEPRPMA